MQSCQVAEPKNPEILCAVVCNIITVSRKLEAMQVLLEQQGIFMSLCLSTPLCARKVFIAYFTIGITVTFA